jgi:hypothetical protein
MVSLCSTQREDKKSEMRRGTWKQACYNASVQLRAPLTVLILVLRAEPRLNGTTYTIDKLTLTEQTSWAPQLHRMELQVMHSPEIPPDTILQPLSVYRYLSLLI